MKRFSIVIATYNSENTLRQTLESIEKQTFKDYEVIIVDGLSTDKTEEIVKDYSSIIGTYISEKDSGIYDAFNKGVSASVGEYINFIGSNDCFYDYQTLEKVSEQLDDKHCPDILSGPVCEIDPASGVEWKANNRISKEEILSGKMIPHAGMFVKT